MWIVYYTAAGTICVSCSEPSLEKIHRPAKTTSEYAGGYLCLYPVNGAFHFIPPHVPAGGGAAGEQLHPGHVPHQGLNAAAGLVRFPAVLLDMGDNDLVDVPGPPFGVAPGRQKAQFRVGPRPMARPPKYRVGFPAQLHPDCSFANGAQIFCK